jgi:cytochrome P450
MSNTPDMDWDPRDDSVLRDQRAAYDDMRQTCPVAHSEFLNWSLFRHEDITHVLANPETYSSMSRHLAVPNGMDPPAHTLYREVLAPSFEDGVMASIEPGLRQIALATVQAWQDPEHVDAVSAFSEPYALQAICAYLGWPLDIWEHLRGWMHGNQQVAFSRDRAAGKVLAATMTGYVQDALDRRRESGEEAMESVSHYVKEAMEERREHDAQPTDDITARIMATEVNGKRLSDEEIVSVLRNWVAGHGTVAAAIEILVYHLAQDQALQQRLRADRTLVPEAIDEILRGDGPLVANRRTTTREVEIGGRQIDAGETLTLMWIAANRDPDVFDDAGDIQIDRDPEENLLFGAGIHVCLGAPLARLEMRIAIEELLAGTKTIELAAGLPPERDIYPGNGFRSLPIEVTR